MKPDDLDFRIIEVIRAFRILKNLKQINLANTLGMTEANYCKYEAGRMGKDDAKAFSGAAIIKIANYLGVTPSQILDLANFENLKHFEPNPVSKILVEHILKLQERGEVNSFTKEELELLILKIKETYNAND